MMNLYREDENQFKPKKDVLKDVKLAVNTSSIYRFAMLKKAERLIKKASVEDFETLKTIEEIIRKYELTEDQFGPELKGDLLALFNEKMAKSQELADRDIVQV